MRRTSERYRCSLPQRHHVAWWMLDPAPVSGELGRRRGVTMSWGRTVGRHARRHRTGTARGQARGRPHGGRGRGLGLAARWSRLTLGPECKPASQGLVAQRGRSGRAGLGQRRGRRERPAVKAGGAYTDRSAGSHARLYGKGGWSGVRCRRNPSRPGPDLGQGGSAGGKVTGERPLRAIR